MLLALLSKVHHLLRWLVCSLFNDAFSVTRLYSVDDKNVNEDELEKIWSEEGMA
jgi:hypothetical protein